MLEFPNLSGLSKSKKSILLSLPNEYTSLKPIFHLLSVDPKGCGVGECRRTRVLARGWFCIERTTHFIDLGVLGENACFS